MKKILVIEDTLQIRENTAELLTLANYVVITAENGSAGIEAALNEAPDLIICDVTMPGIDGFDVLNTLHQTQLLKQVPFIFLTARTDRADFRYGMDIGADDYITKPFTDADLLTTVTCHLERM